MNHKRSLASIPSHLVRFAATGVIATLTHTFIVLCLVQLASFTPGVSNFVAFILSTMVSYVTNALWSFGTSMSQRNALRFAGVSVLCGGLAGGVATMVARAGYPVLAGIATVVVVVTPVSFLLHKYWTFAQR